MSADAGRSTGAPVLPMPSPSLLIPAPRLPVRAGSDRAVRLQARWSRKTQPPGALGRLQALSIRIAQALASDEPRLVAPQLVVFAGDHGITRQGVSAYPAEVTPQMVLNMLAGGAAVAVLARQHGLTLTVVDCGVAVDLPPAPGLVIAKVCHGTADSTREPALTLPQCDAALAHGAALVDRLPGNTLLLGEMGIGNTSAAALLMARCTGRPLADCVGRGTGLDDAGLALKHAVLQRALDLHAGVQAPRDVLAALGGAEIATMCGAVLRAAACQRLVVVDGFISTAAVAVAEALQPGTLNACVFAHASAESGHKRWLGDLGVEPLLDLDLRLGEGSGAALAWPLLVSSVQLLAEMATFDSAGVSNREEDPQ
jgi:nicotinate-nucleotide--dimethylbenzimidazole phosphoribosyltransferase